MQLCEFIWHLRSVLHSVWFWMSVFPLIWCCRALKIYVNSTDPNYPARVVESSDAEMTGVRVCAWICSSVRVRCDGTPITVCWHLLSMYESSLTLHYLETEGGDAARRGRERGQDGDAGILQRRRGSAVCPTHRPALNLTNYSALYPPISPSVIPPSFHTSLRFIPLLCFYLFSHHLSPPTPLFPPFLLPERTTTCKEKYD